MNIIIEGPDCVGKTTVANILAERIANSVYVRMPGYTRLGEFLRPLLKDCRHMNELTRMMLFATADLDAQIQIDKNQDRNYICDRSGLSGLVYRMAAGEVKAAEGLAQLIDYNHQVLMPENSYVFYLTAPDELLDARGSGRCDEKDEGSHFKDNVRAVYRTLSNRLPWHVININESTTPEYIADIIFEMSVFNKPVARITYVQCLLSSMGFVWKDLEKLSDIRLYKACNPT